MAINRALSPGAALQDISISLGEKVVIKERKWYTTYGIRSSSHLELEHATAPRSHHLQLRIRWYPMTAFPCCSVSSLTRSGSLYFPVAFPLLFIRTTAEASCALSTYFPTLTALVESWFHVKRLPTRMSLITVALLPIQKPCKRLALGSYVTAVDTPVNWGRMWLECYDIR